MIWCTIKLSEISESQVKLWTHLHNSHTTNKSPFATYEFAKAVDRIRGGVYASFHQRDKAIVPFQTSYLGIPRIAEKVGGHLSDYFVIVGENQVEFDPASFLSQSGLSALSFDHLVPHKNISLPPELQVSQGIKVEIPNLDTYKEQLRNNDRKFVNEVERLSRQLTTLHGPIDFKLHTTNPEIELKKLISEKRAQYLASGTPDVLQHDWTRNLLGELLFQSNHHCEAILSTLYAGSTWVASNLSLRYLDTVHIWFPVFNHDLRRFGPGHILFFNIIEAASLRGAKVFDFGGGPASYKRKYAGYEYDLLKGVLRSRGIYGTAFQVAQSIGWRVSPLINKINRSWRR